MQINSVTVNAIALATWQNTTRTITNDPAGALNSEGAGTSVTTAAVQSTLGSYSQIVASTAHTVRGIILWISPPDGLSYRLVVSTGAGGSEAIKLTLHLNTGTTQSNLPYYIPLDVTLIPKGTRVAIAASNDSNALAKALSVSIDLLEAAD